LIKVNVNLFSDASNVKGNILKNKIKQKKRKQTTTKSQTNRVPGIKIVENNLTLISTRNTIIQKEVTA